jgi:hypothetical protein
MKRHETANFYPITVDYGMNVEDYGMNVEEAVRLGKYDWVNSSITSQNFPTTRKGKTELRMELIHFDRWISTRKALKGLDRRGYRPAELHELLTLGAQYPDLQREFPIVALASVWQSPNGNRKAPCLDGTIAGRNLDLCWLGKDWAGNWRFAAVRK